MIKHTRWHYYTEGGERYRIDAEYGIDYAFARRNNQAPDFSVAGAIERKSRNNHWYHHSGGQVDRELSAYVPEIAPYLKWHLVGPDGPMHYLENAKYWLEMFEGRRKAEAYVDLWEAFRGTIVLGAFPGDALNVNIRRGQFKKAAWRGPKEWSPGVERLSSSWPEVQAWLQERLPKLQAAWVVDMGELGVLEEGM